MKVEGKNEKNFYNLLCFIVLFINAILTLLGGLLKGSVLLDVLKTVTDVFMLIVLSISGFKFVANKGKGWKAVFWVSFAVYLVAIAFIWLKYLWIE